MVKDLTAQGSGIKMWNSFYMENVINVGIKADRRHVNLRCGTVWEMS